MCSYWMAIFILPEQVIKLVEKKCSDFIWGVGNTPSGKKKAKIAWNKLTYPKAEGGLGVNNLISWNMAWVARNIWSMFCRSESDLVAW
ncbi:hypothetical protein LINPERPRIM_LOCUS2161 [Linum perenne]